jgi:hypothetical protein
MKNDKIMTSIVSFGFLICNEKYKHATIKEFDYTVQYDLKVYLYVYMLPLYVSVK